MAAQGIRIRQAVDSDARGIARVHVDSWRSTYAGILPAEHLAALDYDRREANWRPLLADRRQNVFVAEDQRGRIIGFVSGGPERNDDAAYPGELYAIYLLESCKGLGLGRRLVAALVEWFLSRGWQSMLLWVLEDNPSRGFYEALGGVRIKRETVAIGGSELVEIAYGWNDIAPLTTGS